ncbi:DUF2771 domain-containing protein [Nocardia arizonensis]|uniref:DUF2771 domain-containing protein n=1 Tax=Nocardia arizonensis TaxID=1141647 RepID=UPI0006D17671|nr:DUF2771 domain-containing protein [Nocardia arizonensis]
MTKPGTRTILVLVAVALIVVAAAVAGVVAVAVRNAPQRAPELTAYAHGRTVDVAPFAYCAVNMRDCAVLPASAADAADTVFEQLPCAPDAPECQRGRTVDLAVPPGYPLQLSLPKRVADAPWIARVVYVTEKGDRVDEVISRNDYPEGSYAVTIDSRPVPELRLVGVELQLPILARDQTGREIYVPHAAWSISTV